MASTIIDPAWEISELITRFSKLPASTEPTWTIIQNVTGVSGADFYDLLSIVAQRLIRLKQFVSTLNDDEFDEIKRKRATQAVEHFEGMFSSASLSQRWNDTKQNHVNLDDALQFSWLSLVAKRYRPLRRLTDDERKELTKKLDEAISEFGASTDIPLWAREPLADGLRRLRLVTTKMEFFGYEAAIDELLSVYHRASEVEDHLKATNSATTNRSLSISAVLNAIALAVTLFSAVDVTTTAFEHYRGWQLEQIKSSPRLEKCQTRLLPAPKDRKDTQEQEPVGTLESGKPKSSESNGVS